VRILDVSYRVLIQQKDVRWVFQLMWSVGANGIKNKIQEALIFKGPSKRAIWPWLMKKQRPQGSWW